MHICREVNLASFSSWMYIAYIFYYWFEFTPLLIHCFGQKGGEEFVGFVFTLTPLLMIDKKGKKYLVYMHVFLALFIKGEKDLCLCIYVFVLQIGEKWFDVFHACLCMFISLFMHICLFSFMHFIIHLFVYCYAWVKGELLWSLVLIHACITSWVLSSSKRGRLLAQRPITLVLMMINSCSYFY